MLTNNVVNFKQPGPEFQMLLTNHFSNNLADDPINTFFITDPLVRGERRDIDIGALIPAYMREQLPQDMRETFPTHVSLSCEEEHKVFFIDPSMFKHISHIARKPVFGVSDQF